MTTTAVREDRAVSGGARVSAALWRRAWLRATLTLSPPLAWFLVIYLASLLVMLVTAFWTVNPFTNSLVHSWTLANFQQIFTPTYLTIIARTVIMAAVVTVTDAVLALPFAYFMARVATPRGRQALFIAVLLPLWASYLARVYAWIVILQKGGTLSWTLSKLGLGTVNIGYTNIAMWIVFSYIWLPFMIVPIYGALERIPDSLLEASGDLGARNWRTLRSVVLPLALPGVVAGSIFTFSLTLGDFITPILVGGANSSFIGNVIYSNIGTAGNLPFAAALAVVPIVIMIFYLSGARAARRVRGDVMEGRLARIGLRIWVAGVLLFLFVPIATICLYAFNSSNVQSWPIHGLSTKWFTVAWHDPQVRAAFVLSLKAGLLATAVALLLGSAAAFGVHRFRFFGREAVSLLLVLPLALPGIITGIALNSAFHFAGIGLSLYTIIIGHATFCIVVVYNNVLARLRRISGSVYEAAADLGAQRAADVPHRDAAGHVHRADLRRAARLRALVRRGDRDHLHRRRAEHAAAVDLRRHPARAAASRGQRRGHVRSAAHRDPGGDLGPADRRRRDDPGLGRDHRGRGGRRAGRCGCDRRPGRRRRRPGRQRALSPPPPWEPAGGPAARPELLRGSGGVPAPRVGVPRQPGRAAIPVRRRGTHRPTAGAGPSAL